MFPHNFKGLIEYIISIFNLLMPIIFALSLLVFFWGLVKFLYKAGDAKSHAEGKNLIIWGVIGLFVMLSYYGIISIFYNDLGFNTSFTMGIPLLPQPK